MLVYPTVKRHLGVCYRSDAELSLAANAFLKCMQRFVPTSRGLSGEVAKTGRR